MARKTTTFNIDGYEKSFTVNELTVKEIIGLMQEDESEDVSLEGFRDKLSKSVLPKCTNVTMDELIEMVPSDIKIIWDKFNEVNSVFFDVAHKMGLQSMLDELKAAIIADFSRLLVSSLKLDIPTS